MDSIAVGDSVVVLAKVTAIVGGQVIIDIDGESLTVSPSRLRRPTGGVHARDGMRRKGREARAAGKSISDCPYEHPAYRSIWIKGWMEGG